MAIHPPGNARRARSSADQETLARVVDDLPLGIALLRPPELVFVHANRRFKEIVGSDSLSSVRLDAVWRPSERPDAERLLSVLQNGEAIESPDVVVPRMGPAAPGPVPPRHFSVRYCRVIGDDAGPLLLVEATEITDLVRARDYAGKALAEARWVADTLSDVFEAMEDGFFTLDHEWCFTYLNTKAEEFLHHERVDLIGRTWWEAFPDTLGTIFEQKFRQAVRDRVPVSFEEYYEPHDMWASVYAIPSTAGLSVYLSNVTEQKHIEAALATSEGQLRAFIENSPAVVYMKDLDGRFIRVNEEFARRFEIPKEDMIGLTDTDLLPPSTARRLRENDETVKSSGAAHQFEEDVELPDGQPRTYLSVKFPLKDASGRVYGVAGISTDINDRIVQQRALAASEQQFRKIFEEGPLGIALLDPTLTFHQVNDRYAEMLGYSKDELFGKTLSEVAHESDGEAALPVHQLLRGEIPYYHVEQQFRRRDGLPIWLLTHGSLIRDDEGNPMFVMALVEDISHRKAAETALREKDRQIRQAYSDVIAAVTGGKLVLMTPDEIADALGKPVGEPQRIERYEELAPVRHEIAASLLKAGVGSREIDSLILAACEAFTNALKHGGVGEVRVFRSDSTVQISITDHGKGIDFENLPRATLLAGFSTAQTLGVGFTIMLDVCDRVLLSTQRGLTVIVLEASLARVGQGRSLVGSVSIDDQPLS